MKFVPDAEEKKALKLGQRARRAAVRNRGRRKLGRLMAKWETSQRRTHKKDADLTDACSGWVSRVLKRQAAARRARK